MRLFLPTSSTFVRRRLPQTRARLVGGLVASGEVDPLSVVSTVLFSASESIEIAPNSLTRRPVASSSISQPTIDTKHQSQPKTIAISLNRPVEPSARPDKVEPSNPNLYISHKIKKDQLTSSPASWWRTAMRSFAIGLAVIVVGVSVGLVGPVAYYALFPPEVVPISTELVGTPMGGAFADGAVDAAPTTQRYQPAVDPSLPEGNWLIIPRIGVRTQPQPTEVAEDALATGVWLVPDFGRPGDTQLPVIMAAHRYGWQWWWRDDYWRYHSFYNLPDLQPGDVVEVIVDQRKWVYEIYAGEEGDEITDYTADLILYTCKFLNSPIRHFRYARLIDPTKDTQVKIDISDQSV